MKIMPFSPIKLNRILLTVCFTLLAGCQDQVEKDPYNWAWLIAPQDKILVKLALKDEDQNMGLSGQRDDVWPDDQGMLFLYPEHGSRAFWMPDTYFNLDLFFFDENFKIIDIERNVPHFIGRYPEEDIPLIRAVWARHVLEMKTKSRVGQRLRVGDQLRFQSPVTHPQIK